MALVRLLTYNVHGCRGLDGRISPERIARVIALLEPDIVALQELDVRRRRSRLQDQPREIARILRMNSLFHSTVRVAREEYGTAVLSRWPIRLIRAGPLPTLTDRAVENRGALWVAVRSEAGDIHVVNTHLGLTRGERRLQADALLGPEWLGHPDCREPRILCGDFNMTSRGEVACFDGVCVRARWDQAGPPPRTWPSVLPVFRLDHVFFSAGISLRAVEAPRPLRTRIASDHLPVLATFEIRIRR